MMDEITARRLQIAKSLIGEIEVNIQYGFYNSAVNRMYYACFHAVRAILHSMGVTEAKKHSGVRHMFNQHVILTGKLPKEWSQFYSVIFECRSDADYDDEQTYDEQTVLEFLPKVKEFIHLIENIITTAS